MKKILLIYLSIISLTAFAQQKKVAVYVTGEDASINKVLSSKLSYAIGRNDNYSVIERTDGFLAAIAEEQSYQRTGAVNDEEISRIGKQYGAQLVCVTTIDKAFDIPFISARLIDVETAEIEGAANFSRALTTSKDVMIVGDTLTSRLLKSTSSRKVLAWKKVAVYITKSDASKNIAHILRNMLVAGFANTGRYVAVERTSSFLSQLGVEQNYQRSGSVDDKEISRLGKQLGVHYVCIVDVTEVLDEKYMSARIIDVETAEIINMYEAAEKIDDIESCIKTANQITQKLSKGTYEEQQYEDSHYTGYYDYTGVLNNHSAINIPNWFMNLSGNTYVGISMPGGDAIDAIGMALIQKILATNLNVWSYEANDNAQRADFFEQVYKKAHIPIYIETSYNILELAKLPSEEYLCRIIDGHRNKLRMEITFDEESISTKSEKEEIEKKYHTIKLEFKYDNRSYEMNIDESIMNKITDNSSYVHNIQYTCFYNKKFNHHEYSFQNIFKDSSDNNGINKMLYVFPTPQTSDSPALLSHTYSYNPQKCLAEQLIVFYMDMIRKAFPDNKSGHVVRKKTPIVSQQYYDGTFIIKTTSEE